MPSMENMGNTARLLIVEDERIALRNLEHVMKKEGYDVRSTTSGANALKMLEEAEFDVVLTDLKMEKVDGLEVLDRAIRLQPMCEVVMITAYASIPSAVETMKKGAYDYIAKPFKLEEVRKVVKEAVEKVRLKRENANLRAAIEQMEGKVRIITRDPSMERILETARQVAPTDCNVLITGESGTGKEMLAKYIHNSSSRASGPYVGVNCGAFTEDLLANELFGHEKGAFTGATESRRGIIEAASGGTLFLDEITEMSPAMQVKLLRVVEEREVLPLGATQARKVDIRLLAATNRDPQEMVRTGKFRQDLYFRLNVVMLQLPPLASRPNDIPLLCHHFIRKHATIMKKPVEDVTPEAVDLLMSYGFPGNVRELENIIERGVALTTGRTMGVEHLPEDLRELSIKAFRKREGRIPSLEDQEVEYIRWVLKETGGNRTLAADALGIDRVSLWRKIKKYGIDAPEQS